MVLCASETGSFEAGVFGWHFPAGRGAEDDEGIKVHGGAKGVHPEAGGDGISAAGICRRAGIGQLTYFAWEKKYGGLLQDEMRRRKQIKDVPCLPFLEHLKPEFPTLIMAAGW